MKALKRILFAVLILLVGILGTALVRTVKVRSRQVDVGPGAAAPPFVVDQDAAAGRLAEALRFPTLSKKDRTEEERRPFVELLDWFERTYPTVYAALEAERREGGSLLLHWRGRDPSLAAGLFMSHLDVVPVEPGTEADWTHPPYAGTVADGFVWGRGALDDKGGAVALHEAIALHLLHGLAPDRDLWFAFGHDEEIGGAEGNARIAAGMQEQGIRLAFVVDEGGFILDGALPELGDRPLAMVDVAEKGYATVHLAVRGEGGHSSAPPETTSVGRIARALARLEEHPFGLELTAPMRAQFEHLAPEMPFGMRLILANLWLFRHRVLVMLSKDQTTNPAVRTTTAETMVSGGVKENVLPQHAEATVNFRLLPGTTPDDVLAHVRDVIDDPEVEATLGLTTDPPPAARIGSPWYRGIARSVREVYRDAVVVPGLGYGATDSRHYGGLTTDIYRFQSIRLDLADVSGFHGTDERVAVVSHARAIEILARMLQHLGARTDGE